MLTNFSVLGRYLHNFLIPQRYLCGVSSWIIFLSSYSLPCTLQINHSTWEIRHLVIFSVLSEFFISCYVIYYRFWHSSLLGPQLSLLGQERHFVFGSLTILCWWQFVCIWYSKHFVTLSVGHVKASLYACFSYKLSKILWLHI